MKIERTIPEKPRFETISAQHQFTKDEMVAIGQELGRKNNELTNAEQKKKEVTSQLKAEEDRIQSHVTVLAQKAANGYEFRDIKCEVKLIPAERKKQLIFNGEVKEEKLITQDELQRELPLPVWEYNGELGKCSNPANINFVLEGLTVVVMLFQTKEKAWVIEGQDDFTNIDWTATVDYIVESILFPAADKVADRKEKGCLAPRKSLKKLIEDGLVLQLEEKPVLPGETLTITAE